MDGVCEDTAGLIVWYNAAAAQRMHTWVHWQIYITKNTWWNRQNMWMQTGVRKDRHTHPSPQIYTPGEAQRRGDNKSHFRHVCQVSRKHLSPGWIRRMGYESSKQRPRYPRLEEPNTLDEPPSSRNQTNTRGTRHLFSRRLLQCGGCWTNAVKSLCSQITYSFYKEEGSFFRF